jgi:hypothetical protein
MSVPVNVRRGSSTRVGWRIAGKLAVWLAVVAASLVALGYLGYRRVGSDRFEFLSGQEPSKFAVIRVMSDELNAVAVESRTYKLATDYESLRSQMASELAALGYKPRPRLDDLKVWHKPGSVVALYKRSGGASTVESWIPLPDSVWTKWRITLHDWLNTY